MAPHTVSILICTRDRAPSLRQTLDSLAASGVPDGWPRPELVLIDNASGDDTPGVIAAAVAALPGFDVRHHRQAGGGKTVGLNAALAATAGRAVLFSDDDVRFPPDWVGRMTRPILAGDADAVAGGVRLAPHLARPWMTPLHRSWLADTAGLRPAEGDLVGANMAVDRAALRRVGGFDERLGPGALGFRDDSVLGWRLRRAGCRIVDGRDVAVEHHFDADRLTRRSFVDAAAKHGRSAAHFMRAYQGYRRRWPRLRRWRERLRLLAYRAAHPATAHAVPAERELELLVWDAFWGQYAADAAHGWGAAEC